MVSDELAQALSDCLKKLPDHLLDEFFQIIHSQPGQANLNVDGPSASRRFADPNLDTPADRQRRLDRALQIAEAVLTAHELNVDHMQATPISVASTDVRDMRREAEHLSSKAPNAPPKYFEPAKKQGKKRQPAARQIIQATIAGLADWYESSVPRQRLNGIALLYRAEQKALGNGDPGPITADSKEVLGLARSIDNWEAEYRDGPVTALREAFERGRAGEIFQDTIPQDQLQKDPESFDAWIVGTVAELVNSIE